MKAYHNRPTCANPNAVKFLQNITSVNNAEWLCQTCMKHLKSRKEPSMAVVNGMKSPEKPFTLINLSACLLPQISFSKNYASPKG